MPDNFMNKLTVGPSIPKKGSRIMQFIAKRMLRMAGWDIQGEIPDENKLIFLVAPHTSNWDFIVGLLTLFSLRIEIHWMGKHTMFKKPVAGLFKKLGGIPINRGSASAVVNETVMAFRNRKNLILTIAPEGTRKKVNKWKMGFYFIAQRASIPIVITTMDFKRKAVHFGPTVRLSGEKQKDIQIMMESFTKVNAKNPDNFSPHEI